MLEILKICRKIEQNKVYFMLFFCRFCFFLRSFTQIKWRTPVETHGRASLHEKQIPHKITSQTRLGLFIRWTLFYYNGGAGAQLCIGTNKGLHLFDEIYARERRPRITS